MSITFKIIYTLEHVETYSFSANSLNEAICAVAIPILRDRNIAVERILVEESVLRIVVVDALLDISMIPDSVLFIVSNDGTGRKLFDTTLHEWMAQFNLLFVSEKTHISRFIHKGDFLKRKRWIKIPSA